MNDFFCTDLLQTISQKKRKTISALQFSIKFIIFHRNCLVFKAKTIFIVEVKRNESEKSNTSFYLKNLKTMLILS